MAIASAILIALAATAIAASVAATTVGIVQAEQAKALAERQAENQFDAEMIAHRQEQRRRAQEIGITRERARLHEEQFIAKSGAGGFAATQTTAEFTTFRNLAERDVERIFQSGGQAPVQGVVQSNALAIAGMAISGVGQVASIAMGAFGAPSSAATPQSRGATTLGSFGPDSRGTGAMRPRV